MRYFKFRWNEAQDPERLDWGGSTWYYEFGSDGSTNRQVMLYDNGHRLHYDLAHSYDDYGELLWDVKLDEFDVSQGQEIDQSEFETIWQSGPWTNDSQP